jgi:WD40 repeat protein
MLSILVCSCDNGEDGLYGSDTRWQQYTTSRESPSREITLLGQNLACPNIAVSSDNQKVLYGNCGSRFYLTDMDSGDRLLRLKGHPEPTQCLSFSPDGIRAVSGGADGTVRLWDLAGGRQIGLAEGHHDYIRSVAYSPVEEKALSGCDLGEILLWDLEKMQVMKQFAGHSSGIRHGCLAWAQDGKTFLSGSWDGSIRLWDIQTGEEITHINAGYGRVMSLALSPDGEHALSSYLNGPNQPIIFWDLENQREINRFGVPGNPWYADRQLHVASVAFALDGETALFGLVFGTVIWWDLSEWRQIAMNRLHEDELVFVAYSADGESCISVGSDSITEDAELASFP